MGKGWKRERKRGWVHTSVTICTSAFFCLTAVFCGAVFLGGCAGTGSASVKAPAPKTVNYKADDYDSWNELMQENQISDSFKDALEQFAFQSGSRVLRAGHGNVNYSPLSLYYALAMAGCGADGETAAQIMDSLGVQDQSQLSGQCRKLYQWFYYDGQHRKSRNQEYKEEDDSSIELANSLWISNQLKLKKDYRKMAAAQFFASSYQVDFTSREAGVQMGKWISQETDGVMQPELQLSSDTMMAILNTLYFYGGWKGAFSVAETADDNFTKTDGSQVTCSFMNRVDNSGRFRKGDGCTVSALATGNNCSMVFLLPDQGHSVDEFLNTPEQLETYMDTDYRKWKSGKVTWKVPKFSFGSTFELTGLLQDMGVEKMFVPKAEFSKISESPLFVTNVIQETHMGIDEKGVEGAAYTMIVLEEAGIFMSEEKLEADMILDRPFIYGIQDNRTGTWLFLGVCRNPADGQ